jgi:hypothetical protein
MEPFLNADLDAGTDTDLTYFQLQDIGWKVSLDGRKMCGDVRWWRQADPTKKRGAGGGSACYHREKPR